MKLDFIPKLSPFQAVNPPLTFSTNIKFLKILEKWLKLPIPSVLPTLFNNTKIPNFSIFNKQKYQQYRRDSPILTINIPSTSPFPTEINFFPFVSTNPLQPLSFSLLIPISKEINFHMLPKFWRSPLSFKTSYFFPITALKILYSEQKLEGLLQEIDDLKQRCQKYLQDFRLFKNRMDKTQQSIEEKITFQQNKKLLPILDILEQIQQLNFASLKPSKLRLFSLKVFENLEVLYSQLLMTLKIIPITPRKGTPYDDHFQEASSLEYDPLFPPNTVIKVIRKGYLYGQTLLRPAEVSLSIDQCPPQKRGHFQTFFGYFTKIFKRKRRYR